MRYVNLFVISLVLATACVVEEGTPAIEEAAQELVPSLVKPRIRSVDGACWAANVRLEALPGKPTKLELRRRKDGGAWTTVYRRKANVTTIQDDSILPWAATYEYSVRARYGTEASRWSDPAAYANAPCVVPRSPSAVTHTLKVIPVTSSDRPIPYSADQLHDVVFSRAVGAPSLANFLDEISAGYSHTSWIPAVRIDGTVHPWVTLDATAAEILAGGDGLGSWYDTLVASGVSYESPTDGADFYLYVFNHTAPDGGLSTPRPMVSAATAWPGSVRPYATMAHELGHVLFAYPHSASAQCDAAPFPASLTESALAACDMQGYGDPASFMSGTMGAHPSAYWKSQAGFLTGRIAWVNASDEPEPGAEPLPPGSSVVFDLYDSISQHGSSALQLIVLKLDADDTAYMIDYRRAIGLNRYAGTRSLGGGDFREGVYVQLKPGHKFGGPDSARTLQPVRDDGWPLIATTSSSFDDPARNLRITVERNEGSYVRVRIENRELPEAPGCRVHGCDGGPHAGCRAGGAESGYCDDSCTAYGDCCDDYELVCR